jgi:hypothetical protein
LGSRGCGGRGIASPPRIAGSNRSGGCPGVRIGPLIGPLTGCGFMSANGTASGGGSSTSLIGAAQRSVTSRSISDGDFVVQSDRGAGASAPSDRASASGMSAILDDRSSPGESNAGRSARARSAGGRSVRGRSVRGRSGTGRSARGASASGTSASGVAPARIGG